MLQTLTEKKRIESIDILRGIVMVIMALDHVRDYFHTNANTNDPLNLATTTPVLFFTRWITHFCAPVFVFLSGVSIYLQGMRKTKKELSIFLIKRGLWLILVELMIVSLGWSFNPQYYSIGLQVIWAIGISMVILGILIRLPYTFILVLGLVIVFGHNLLDIPESVPGFKGGFWMDLLHSGKFTRYEYAPGHGVRVVYPFLSWTGLMLVGYCAGIYFSEKFSPGQRAKKLNSIGFGLLLLFVLLRYSNVYGDPDPWSVENNNLLTFFSFIKVHKYPPSLLYMCITIGLALLLLPFLEKCKNGFTDMMRTYGRVAFFYYILHLYLVHLVSAACYLLSGHSFREATTLGPGFPFYFLASRDGYSLPVVYVIWIAVLVALYPVCKWYDQYKTNHREKWWLSYF